jgi:predicted tellurium resistance membrane protein TerC
MSGLGQVFVEPPNDGKLPGAATFIADRIKEDMQSSVHTPGIWALFVGLIAIVAGAAYLWTQWRSQTALTAAIVGGIEFLMCVRNAINVAAMMGNPAGDARQYAIGFGLLLACAVTLVLIGLGITAFVLERFSIGARQQG